MASNEGQFYPNTLALFGIYNDTPCFAAPWLRCGTCRGDNDHTYCRDLAADIDGAWDMALEIENAQKAPTPGEFAEALYNEPTCAIGRDTVCNLFPAGCRSCYEEY